MLQVNLFQPKSICFNLSQFDFFLAFAANKKNFFWHLRPSLHPPSLHLHSTYFSYYYLPALPTSQPVLGYSRKNTHTPDGWQTGDSLRREGGGGGLIAQEIRAGGGISSEKFFLGGHF